MGSTAACIKCLLPEVIPFQVDCCKYAVFTRRVCMMSMTFCQGRGKDFSKTAEIKIGTYTEKDFLLE